MHSTDLEDMDLITELPKGTMYAEPPETQESETNKLQFVEFSKVQVFKWDEAYKICTDTVG